MTEPVLLPEIDVSLPASSPRNPSSSGETAEVNELTLLALEKSLTSQNKADVSDSLLFGQLAANKSIDRFSNPDEWWLRLTNVLAGIGWGIVRVTKVDAAIYLPPLDWRDLAELRFTDSYGSTPPLVAAAIQAAARQSASSPAVELWARTTSFGQLGLFQIGLADTKEGGPRLSLLMTSFSLTTESPGILDWSAGANATGAYAELVLNTDVYGQVRSQIIEKLGERITTDVRQVPL